MTMNNSISVEVLAEEGYKAAMFGLSLNKDQDIMDMPRVALKLYNADGGHNKFLEHMFIWLNVNAPRYFWSEYDTYRVALSKQSQSTMHTITRKPLTPDNFVDRDISEYELRLLNQYIALHPKDGTASEKATSIRNIKKRLPEGFMQRREIVLNYKTLRNIVSQRKTHRLKEWGEFCSLVYASCRHPEFLRDLMEDK